MELHELHVHQVGACVVREGVAVCGVFPAIAGDREGLADPTSCQHDRLGPKDDELAAFAEIAECAGDAVVVLEEGDDRALHVEVDSSVDAVILESANHFEARPVADVSEAGILVAAEIALENAAILGAIEKSAPGLEFENAGGRLLGMHLGHTRVVEVLAAAHRVGEVDAPVVTLVDVADRRRDAAFRHDGMSLAEEGLGDNADLDAGG